MNTVALVNASILLVLLMVVMVYGIDMRVPYPKRVILAFDEPIVRILTYALIYHVAYYNAVISVFAVICVVFLHIDLVNLKKPMNK